MTWKFFIGCFSLLFIPSIGAAATLPISNGLVLHLEADNGVTVDSNTGIARTWSDQSGLGNHLSSTGEPTLASSATLSGKPALRFDGINDALIRKNDSAPIKGLPIGNADRTVFMVANYRKNNWSSGFSYGSPSLNKAYGLAANFPNGELALQGWGYNNDLVSTKPGIGTGWLVQSGVLASGKSALFRNGAEIASFNHQYQTGNQSIALGVEIAGLGYSQMDVAAIIIYNRALSQSEQDTVNAYLQVKYFETNYIPKNGLVLHLEADSGVSIDPSTNIVKRWTDQSGSGNDLISIGKPKLVNDAAPSGLPALRLDGIVDVLIRDNDLEPIINLPTANTNRTVFLVAKYQNNSWWSGFSFGSPTKNKTYGLVTKYPSGELVVQGWGSGNDLVSNTVGIGRGWLVQSGLLNNSLSSLFKNGISVASFNHKYETGNELIILGAEIADLGYSQMDVAAVMIYNRALSEEELNRVNSYLYVKYLDEDYIPSVPVPEVPVPEVPNKSVVFFDGKTINGVYEYSKELGRKPNQGVFTVSNGMMRVASDATFATLISNASYENYILTLEFKWGTESYGSRKGKARDGGIMLHSQGGDSEWHNILMPNIEVQIMEGGTGDLILLKGNGPMRMSGKTSRSAVPNKTWNYRDGYIWDSKGITSSFSSDLGSIHRLGWDSNWRDVTGFVGTNNPENPHGQWNTVKAISNNGTIEVFVNGKKVNEAFNVFPTSGKIQIESEQAEYFVRLWKIELLP